MPTWHLITCIMQWIILDFQHTEKPKKAVLYQNG